MSLHDHDTRIRFVFEHSHIRGEWVHLDATWQALLARRDYPPALRELLGQMMAAGALLTSTIKFDGSLTLQIEGSGPVALLVVQAQADRTLRGTAQFDAEALAGLDAPDLPQLVGNARLALTIDPDGPSGRRDRYQGIVALDGSVTDFAQALELYFRQSEQLDTRLWLAADPRSAAGLLLQRLPGAEWDSDLDLWDRSTQLAATLATGELLGLGHRALLHRLFHEEDLRLFDPEPVSFRCRCSRERIEAVLRGFGYDEVQAILAEEGGRISTRCEFCFQAYFFDAVDCEALFAAAETPPPGSRSRH